MKDILVFEKTDGLGCAFNCEGCDLLGDFCNRLKKGTCELSKIYKLVKEEPKKIQSEYEHREERFDMLCKHCFDSDDPLSDERETLDVWLKNNKPTNFQPCTKENTKVGDEVRVHKNPVKMAIVEHIYREMHFCTIWDTGAEKTICNYQLNCLEIDTYKNRGEE